MHRQREEKEMGEGYGTLRLWSTVLMLVGILGVIFVVIGTILAVLFASWPIALGQGLRALADVAEYVQRQQQGVPAQRLSEGEQVPRD
jgi:hypothetical protein